MGLRDLFSSYNETQRALLELYSSMMIGTMASSEHEARRMAEDMLRQAIEESKKEGSYHLPHNFGDMLLGHVEANDAALRKAIEEMRRNLAKKKVEGVRNEDIRWWWNLNDVERRMMVKIDDLSRMALLLHERSNGKDAAEAALTVRKFHPMYGDPQDTAHTSGDDRPLPYELKERINRYIEKRGKTDLEKFKAEIEESFTFNALVRKRIRAGDL